MALVSWSDRYSVDVRSVNLEHHKLFDMINELHEAMREGRGAQTAPLILKRLVDYTCQHFAREERLMVQAGYPEIAEHKAQHDNLITQVQKLASDYEQGKVLLTMELPEFLMRWLETHIMGCDKKYSGHLKAAGIQ